jgi:hypothetical protein
MRDHVYNDFHTAASTITENAPNRWGFDNRNHNILIN